MKFQRALRGRFIFTVASGVAIFAGGFAIGTLSTVIHAQTVNLPADAAAAFEPISEVYDLIQSQYIDDIDPQTLADGALRGMVEALGDRFSSYMNAEEYEIMSDDLEGQIEGIGVVIRTDEETGEVEVVGLLEGAPAQLAGVLPGDIFYSVDGVPVETMSQYDLATRVRGPQGSSVLVTMRRGDELIDFNIIRESITVPNVESKVINDRIGYVRLNQFSSTARADLDAALEALNVNALDGLIFDLRDNPGGLLSSAIDIASAFIPDGLILTEAFSDSAQQEYMATGNYSGIEVPIVVLINEGSASASELVAGAMQDRGVATILGETSFGKGTVQTWNTLSNGGGVRLTIARWLTPSGAWIHDSGVTPDIVVEWTPTDYSDPNDPQINAAVDYLEHGAIGEQPLIPAEAFDNAA